MKKFNTVFILLLVLSTFIALSNCGGSAQTAVRDSGTTAAAANSLPDEKDFISEGAGKEFADARIAAYIDFIKKAIIFTIGESAYSQNKASIEKSFFSYIPARKYVLGDVEATTPEKQKKWLSQNRDESGNLVLKLQAFANIKKLKTDLDQLGVKTSAGNTGNTSGNMTTASTTYTSGNDGSKTTDTISSTTENTTTTVKTDYSNIDLSSLTFVVFYNPKNFKTDEDESYAKWAVDALNKQLANIGVQTFDLETMEKLAEEKKLMQESDSGSISMGQLIAQNLYAEIYAEVVPSVTYTGDKANVFFKVKVFVRTTGSLISTVERGGNRQGTMSSSLTGAIKVDMRIAASNCTEEISGSLKKYLGGGRFYNVSLSGVQTYRDASKFSTTVTKMEGLVNITLKSGSKADGIYEYSVQYKGNPTQFVDKVFEYLADKPGYEKFDMKQVKGNDLSFTLE